MRKRAFHIVLSAFVACTVFVCALACVPKFAIAVEGDPTLASAATERVAWAKTQRVSPVQTLALAQGGTNEANVRFYQEFDSSYTGVARTFEYRLLPLSDGAPMPDGAVNGIYAWTFTGDDAGWISIPCAEAKADEGDTVYYYAAYQHISEPQTGYTYDDTVFIVEAHVLANTHEAVAIIRNSDANEGKLTDPGWTVRYEKVDSSSGDSEESTPDDSQSGTYQSSYKPKSGSEPLAKTGDNADITISMLCLLLASMVLGNGVVMRAWRGGMYHG